MGEDMMVQSGSPEGHLRSGSTGSGPSKGGSCCCTGGVVATVGAMEASAAGAVAVAVAAAAGTDDATSAAGSMGCCILQCAPPEPRAATAAAASAGGPSTLLLLGAGSAGRCAGAPCLRCAAGGEGERRRLRPPPACGDRSWLLRCSSRRRLGSSRASLMLPLPRSECEDPRFGMGVCCLRRLAPTAGLDAFCDRLAEGTGFAAGLRR